MLFTLGIVAIIKSSNVNKLWAQGNHEGAQKAADDAKKYSIWGAAIAPAIALIGIVLYYVFIIVILGVGEAFMGL